MSVEGVLWDIAEPLSHTLKFVVEASEQGLHWLNWIWEYVKPHVPWIGWLFGFVVAAWRWWNKREPVVWRRAMKLFEDQGRYLQDACRYSLAAVLYPGPAALPQQPLFAVDALRRVFARRWWQPLRTAGPLQWGKHFLNEAHVELNEKDNAISSHLSFAIAQRYSAFVLEGAIAAADAENAKHIEDRKRLNQIALEKFEDALALKGKRSDAAVLELKGLQLWKLSCIEQVRRIQQAKSEFRELETLLVDQLREVTPLRQDERQRLLVQLMRVVRYQIEIDHKDGSPGQAASHMRRLTQYPVADSLSCETAWSAHFFTRCMHVCASASKTTL